MSSKRERGLFTCKSAIAVAVLAGGLSLPSVVGAQELNYNPGAAPSAQSSQSERIELFCVFDHPGDVQRYAVECDGTTRLDVSIADCCISGDHWQAKVKVWDREPNTAVTTSPGAADVPGVVARVYDYGHPGPLRALIECTYNSGVNVFPAESTVFVHPLTGSCVVDELDLEDEITRTP